MGWSSLEIHEKPIKRRRRKKRLMRPVFLVQNKTLKGDFLSAQPFSGLSGWWTQMDPPWDFLVWGSKSTRSLPNNSSARHARDIKQQLHTMPHSWGRQDSTKNPWDPTKICGSRQSGTIMMSKYRVGKWKRERERGRETQTERECLCIHTRLH